MSPYVIKHDTTVENWLSNFDYEEHNIEKSGNIFRLKTLCSNNIVKHKQVDWYKCNCTNRAVRSKTTNINKFAGTNLPKAPALIDS